MTIRDPEDHWERDGYIELVPAVRPSTNADREDEIRVYARLPEDGRIRVDWLAMQGRHTLRLPAGATIDRVESWKYNEPSGEVRETIVDVRGLRMTGDGPRYHVLRPASGAPRAPLLGWSWPANDSAAHAEATGRLEQFLRGRPAPVKHRALDEAEIATVVENNACGSCHTSDRDGGFALLTVLDTSPVAGRDVAAELAAGDDYTMRLCESRRFVWDHMDAEAREAFADSFRACGLAEAPPTLASASSASRAAR